MGTPLETWAKSTLNHTQDFINTYCKSNSADKRVKIDPIYCTGNEIKHLDINTLRPGDAYMQQWTGSSLPGQIR